MTTCSYHARRAVPVLAHRVVTPKVPVHRSATASAAPSLPVSWDWLLGVNQSGRP